MRQAFGVILLLVVGSVHSATVIWDESVDGDHRSGAVGAVQAVHEHGLIGGGVHDFQKFQDVFIFGMPSLERDALVLQPRALELASV